VQTGVRFGRPTKLISGQRQLILAERGQGCCRAGTLVQRLYSDNLQAADVPTYKQMIAKAIVFKRVQALVRPMFPAFQANVTAYVVSLLSNRLADSIDDLDKIWARQDVSPELRTQIQTWTGEVNGCPW
jgi:hypothetical protein